MDDTITILKAVNSSSFILPKELTIESLYILQCGFLDFPESGIDCSLIQPNVCIKCDIRGGYLTGEKIADRSTGSVITRCLMVLVLIVGTSGALGNLFIMKIFHRRRNKRSFDLLLMFLALVDFSVCFSTLVIGMSVTAIFCKWFGGYQLTGYWIYYVALQSGVLCRSISTYVTCLVTIERYLAIAHPLKSRIWFSQTSTKLIAVLLVAFSIFLSLPRLTSQYFGENIYSSKDGHLNIPSVAKLDYIMRPTKMYYFWFDALGNLHDYWLHVFEFWVPIPMLVFFNVWSYKKIKNVSKERRQLNSTQRQELQVARMFVPVVILLLICNTCPFISLVSVYIKHMYYHELWTLMLLSTQVNSAANFLIYYYRGTMFRNEAKSMLFTCCNSIMAKEKICENADVSTALSNVT